MEIERDEASVPSLLDALFSATQRRLLGLLFGQSERAYQVRELMLISGGGAGAVHRELGRLRRAGLIRTRSDGYRIHVQADPDWPVHEELAELVRNSVGLVEPLREAFAPLARRARLLFVYRDWPNVEFIDGCRALKMVIVAPPDEPVSREAIEYGLQLAEQRLARACDYPLILEPAELQSPDERVQWILARPRTWVFGEEVKLVELLQLR